MEMVIDGHNLIPHMPGINLSDVDDELRLIEQLQVYCRLTRHTVTVFFDRAPVGQARTQQFGRVRAHFVRVGTEADAAIIAYLKKLGKQAKNVIVVSSDRQIEVAARALHARVMLSAAFAEGWRSMIANEPETDPCDQPLSEEEVRYWEDIFNRGNLPEN